MKNPQLPLIFSGIRSLIPLAAAYHLQKQTVTAVTFSNISFSKVKLLEETNRLSICSKLHGMLDVYFEKFQ